MKQCNEKKAIEEWNEELLKYGYFPQLFSFLDGTIKGKAMVLFEKFLERFSTTTKWVCYSDYCIDDNTKNNNVYSFAIFPYIQDFITTKNIVSQNIEYELKEIRDRIPEKTLNYLRQDNFFIFNFVTSKNFFKNYFSDNFDKKSEIASLKKHIEIIEKNWGNNYKQEIVVSLKSLVAKIKTNNFKVHLYRKILLNSFFSAYISILLQSKSKNIDTYSWLSDRDSMTTYGSGILTALYLLRKEEIKKIINTPLKKINEGIHIPLDKIEPFYDELIAIPDYFCGTLATILKENGELETEKEIRYKYFQVYEQVLKNNKNMAIIFLEEEQDKKIRVDSLIIK